MTILRRLAKWTGLLTGGLILLILLVAGGLWLWLLGSLPKTEGELAVGSPKAEVEILRDQDGVVTIRAESLEDAVFGLGFAHAQDRLAQMEMTRLMGQGRMAEVAGSSLLPLDRLMRTLDFARLSHAALDHLEPETLAILDSYAEGVNAFLETRSGPLPPEFLATTDSPAPWSAADSVLWVKLMAMRLSGNWRDELRLARLSAVLDEGEISDLFPELPADSPVTLPDSWREALADPTLLEVLPDAIQTGLGASNAWVIDGARTASGKPVLANDPHLSLENPGTWYLARLETPELVVAGATAPGLPVVVIGHNGFAAWGLTTTHSDTQDLVVETLDPENPERYLTPDGPMAFETREETFHVRGGEPERLPLRRGRFGPVVSDIDWQAQAAGDTFGRDSVLTLAWPALREADTTMDALVRLNRMRGWQDFTAAARRVVAPQQNVFYADIEGNIGFASPALVPIRDGFDGSLPVAGRDRRAIWDGFVPHDELPQARNPAGGLLVNANNRIVGPDYPHLIATRWQEPYRAQRIEAVLEAGTAHDPAGSRTLQLDEVSPMARDLLPLLLSVEPLPGRAADAHRLLAEWDGTMDRDLPQPALLYAWLEAINRGLFAPRLGPLFREVSHWNPRAIAHVLKTSPRWCDPAGGCDAVVRRSLAEALERLESLGLGDNPAAMRWGDIHKARLSHPILGRIPVIGGWFDTVVETGGGNYTINRATPAWSGRRPFEQVHGPGLRAVFDLADLDQSLFVIAAGQSGNPLSPHFGDFTERWRDGIYVKLVAPAQEQGRRLVLTPP